MGHSKPVNGFRFEPELFGYRDQALSELSKVGYEWLAHFTAIDLLHDIYGLEVCGITKESDAFEIQSILFDTFSNWKHGRIDYKDGEHHGWKVIIHRDDEEDSGGRAEA